MFLRFSLLVALSLLQVSCTPRRGGGGGDDSPGDDSGDDSSDDSSSDDDDPFEDPDSGRPDPSGCVEPAAQLLSQPCCLSRGIDACGAGLFCAALDGRTQATCYAEHTRGDGESCTENRQCSSGACNHSEGKCASAPSTHCDLDIGCSEADGYNYLCVDETCTRSDGELGDACLHTSDCATFACVDNRCTSGQASARCNIGADCNVFACVSHTCTNGELNDPCTTDSDCIEETCSDTNLCASPLLRRCSEAASSCSSIAEMIDASGGCSYLANHVATTGDCLARADSILECAEDVCDDSCTNLGLDFITSGCVS